MGIQIYPSASNWARLLTIYIFLRDGLPVLGTVSLLYLPRQRCTHFYKLESREASNSKMPCSIFVLKLQVVTQKTSTGQYKTMKVWMHCHTCQLSNFRKRDKWEKMLTKEGHSYRFLHKESHMVKSLSFLFEKDGQLANLHCTSCNPIAYYKTITYTPQGHHMHTTWVSHVHHMGIMCTPRWYHVYNFTFYPIYWFAYLSPAFPNLPKPSGYLYHPIDLPTSSQLVGKR